MNVLKKILDRKKADISSSKAAVPVAELKRRISDLQEVRSLSAAISRKNTEPLKLIAELKKASPSQGVIRENFNLPEIIAIYNNKPVSAVSVLTEEHFFQGSLEFLREARRRTEKPLLRKDFIIDEYQVYEARAYAADAILLIAGALDRSHLGDLFHLAKELSLDSIVEVHNWKELDAALSCGARIIGINNRNLETLDISLTITFEMLKDIPDDRIVVSESGISTRADIESLERTRVDAVLIGTILMRAQNIGDKIEELMRH